MSIAPCVTAQRWGAAPAWTGDELFNEIQRLELAATRAITTMRNHLQMGNYPLQHYIAMWEPKIKGARAAEASRAAQATAKEEADAREASRREAAAEAQRLAEEEVGRVAAEQALQREERSLSAQPVAAGTAEDSVSSEFEIVDALPLGGAEEELHELQGFHSAGSTEPPHSGVHEDNPEVPPEPVGVSPVGVSPVGVSPVGVSPVGVFPAPDEPPAVEAEESEAEWPDLFGAFKDTPQSAPVAPVIRVAGSIHGSRRQSSAAGA